MKYTVMSKRINMELSHLKKEPFDVDKCFEHPSYFAHHFLGMTPYRYQHLVLRRFRENPKKALKNDRLIVCKGRQMGLSFCFAWLAIWAAFTNKYSSGPFRNTKVGIVSRSDKQAMKLMREIQSLIWHSPKGLGDHIVKDRKNPLSKTEIHFKNGWIKCYPPTDAILGETIDLLIIDEAAMVEDETFNTAMRPTVSKSNGKIILSSTPRGQKGFFFEIFDPGDLRKKHAFKRFWFYWQMCEDIVQKRIIKQEIQAYKDTGNFKKIDQEYNGMFTVDQEAFFEDQQIESGVDRNLSYEYENKEVPCSVGIDYGGVNSETAISVVGHFKEGLRLLFQFSAAEFDHNKLVDPSYEHSVQNLNKRYNILHWVVDDCPPGDTTNRWLQNEGYPVNMFNFKTDASRGERNRGYYVFRAHLMKGKIKFPNKRKLISEMKSLQEIQMEINTRIKGPRNYLDDLIDSFMMACYPFLSNEGEFKSSLVRYKEVTKKMLKADRSRQNHRIDNQWTELNKKGGMYDFMKRKPKGHMSRISEGECAYPAKTTQEVEK